MQNNQFIKIYNTLTGKLEEFQSIHPKEVKFYACGPTVYDYAHIGNFRAFVFEDLLRRFLEFQGYKVKHVMNVTDVDDKTIAGAQKENKSLGDYTAKYLQAFNEDLKALNILPPTEQPRATDPSEMKAMQDLIAKLIEKEIAYVNGGSVYYRVSKFPGYGKLSKKKLEQNITGASERIDNDEYEAKEQVTDFVLWKKAKEGEPSWDSPWGKGRPGWHIECSAMSIRHLGETFDLHAGGEDLVFPHHENEIAQSEGATGKPFVKYWLHCRFLLVNGEKMSKSKGNFYTLRDLLAKGYDPMAIRVALLSTHYRTPLNFTFDGLKEAAEVIKKLDESYFQVLNRYCGNSTEVGTGFDLKAEKIAERLCEDLNISTAFAELLESVTAINRSVSQMGKQDAERALKFFEKIDALFGLDIAQVKTIPAEIFEKLAQQQEFRKNKNFAQADQMRKELGEAGWLVKDGRPGEPSTVKKKRRAWD